MTKKDTRALKSLDLISIEFTRVSGQEEDVQILYDLLHHRRRNISHTAMPSLEDHRRFVLGHPYRFWYLVRQNDAIVGSVYFHFDNSIGINMPNQSSSVVSATLKEALRIHRPLQGRKSVRSRIFFVNASPEDESLEVALRSLGWDVLQVSYAKLSHLAKDVENV